MAGSCDGPSVDSRDNSCIDLWSERVWKMSPANCSPADFQLDWIVKREGRPRTVIPLCVRSNIRSQYQVMGPRYSRSEGADSSNVAKIMPT
jgi:hypothetical protein